MSDVCSMLYLVDVKYVDVARAICKCAYIELGLGSGSGFDTDFINWACMILKLHRLTNSAQHGYSL